MSGRSSRNWVRKSGKNQRPCAGKGPLFYETDLLLEAGWVGTRSPPSLASSGRQGRFMIQCSFRQRLTSVNGVESCLQLLQLPKLSFLVCEMGRILGRCHFNWRDGVWVLGSRG